MWQLQCRKNVNLYTFDSLSCIVLTDMASFESCWPNWQFYQYFYPVSFFSDATQISRQQKYESDEKSWYDPISSICRVWVSSVEWIQGVSKYLRRLSSLMNMAPLFLPIGGGRTHSSSEVVNQLNKMSSWDGLCYISDIYTVEQDKLDFDDLKLVSIEFWSFKSSSWWVQKFMTSIRQSN